MGEVEKGQVRVILPQEENYIHSDHHYLMPSVPLSNSRFVTTVNTTLNVVLYALSDDNDLGMLEREML